MISETIVNFCFIRTKSGGFAKEINQLLHEAFKGMDFTWNLSEKDVEEAELVIAELHGTSDWILEDEVVRHMDKEAGEMFWEYLQGLKIVNKPIKKGCSCRVLH